jgi:SnoaL-like domain
MDPRLQEMLDHYEIRRTLADYCFACDRTDISRMEAVYLEDSWDDHGIHAAPGRHFAHIMTREVAAQTDSLYHLLGQSQIKVEGDKAGAETYFFAAARSTREDGAIMCNQLGGRFVDRLERQEGRWLIRKRVVLREWAISLPVESDWTAGSGLKEGERSMADPAYAALGLTQSDGRAA